MSSLPTPTQHPTTQTAHHFDPAVGAADPCGNDAVAYHSNAVQGGAVKVGADAPSSAATPPPTTTSSSPPFSSVDPLSLFVRSVGIRSLSPAITPTAHGTTATGVALNGAPHPLLFSSSPQEASFGRGGGGGGGVCGASANGHSPFSNYSAPSLHGTPFSLSLSPGAQPLIVHQPTTTLQNRSDHPHPLPHPHPPSALVLVDPLMRTLITPRDDTNTSAADLHAAVDKSTDRKGITAVEALCSSSSSSSSISFASSSSSSPSLVLSARRRADGHGSGNAETKKKGANEETAWTSLAAASTATMMAATNTSTTTTNTSTTATTTPRRPIALHERRLHCTPPPLPPPSSPSPAAGEGAGVSLNHHAHADHHHNHRDDGLFSSQSAGRGGSSSGGGGGGDWDRRLLLSGTLAPDEAAMALQSNESGNCFVFNGEKANRDGAAAENNNRADEKGGQSPLTPPFSATDFFPNNAHNGAANGLNPTKASSDDHHGDEEGRFVSGHPLATPPRVPHQQESWKSPTALDLHFSFPLPTSASCDSPPSRHPHHHPYQHAVECFSSPLFTFSSTPPKSRRSAGNDFYQKDDEHNDASTTNTTAAKATPPAKAPTPTTSRAVLPPPEIIASSSPPASSPQPSPSAPFTLREAEVRDAEGIIALRDSIDMTGAVSLLWGLDEMRRRIRDRYPLLVVAVVAIKAAEVKATADDNSHPPSLPSHNNGGANDANRRKDDADGDGHTHHDSELVVGVAGIDLHGLEKGLVLRAIGSRLLPGVAPNTSYTFPSSYCMCRGLLIHPRYQGGGIGSKLHKGRLVLLADIAPNTVGVILGARGSTIEEALAVLVPHLNNHFNNTNNNPSDDACHDHNQHSLDAGKEGETVVSSSPQEQQISQLPSPPSATALLPPNSSSERNATVVTPEFTKDELFEFTFHTSKGVVHMVHGRDPRDGWKFVGVDEDDGGPIWITSAPLPQLVAKYRADIQVTLRKDTTDTDGSTCTCKDDDGKEQGSVEAVGVVVEERRDASADTHDLLPSMRGCWGKEEGEAKPEEITTCSHDDDDDDTDSEDESSAPPPARGLGGRRPTAAFLLG